MPAPTLIRGDIAVDDRGSLSFVNDFDFKDVKRSYLVTNHSSGFVRAWHGHKKEGKYVSVLRGAALVCAVAIDDWATPDRNAQVHRFVLSALKPAVLFIPAGYANGAMSLTDGTLIQYFGTSSLDDSKGDDYRFDARYWDPWSVEER